MKIDNIIQYLNSISISNIRDNEIVLSCTSFFNENGYIGSKSYKPLTDIYYREFAKDKLPFIIENIKYVNDSYYGFIEDCKYYFSENGKIGQNQAIGLSKIYWYIYRKIKC